MDKKIAFKECIANDYVPTIKNAFDYKISHLGMFSKKEKAALNDLWTRFDKNEELTRQEAVKISELVGEYAQSSELGVISVINQVKLFILVAIADKYDGR